MPNSPRSKTRLVPLFVKVALTCVTERSAGKGLDSSNDTLSPSFSNAVKEGAAVQAIPGCAVATLFTGAGLACAVGGSGGGSVSNKSTIGAASCRAKQNKTHPGMRQLDAGFVHEVDDDTKKPP